MAIVISDSVKKSEFGRSELSPDVISVLKRTARLPLCVPIKGDGLPSGSRLVKAYGTDSHGARRVVYMLASGEEDFLLLFFRDKNDEIGRNITIKNPEFKKALRKQLSRLREDLLSGKFSVLDTEAL